MNSGPTTRAAFEQRLNRLVGRRVRAVYYFELPYPEGPQWARESATFDSLDFGLELDLDDGCKVSITWGHEFTNYNVSILDGPLEWAEGAPVPAWDARDRWRSLGLLDAPITSAHATWMPRMRPEGGDYPQDIRLAFEGDTVVVISAFESRGADFKLPMMDHITVFFDEAEANRLLHRD